jgi:hemerythrin superfamily protein
MFRRRRRSTFANWMRIGSTLAGGAALISLIPTMKKRALLATTILKKDHRVVSGLIRTLQMTPRINGMLRTTLLNQIRDILMIHTQTEEEVLYPTMRNYVVNQGRLHVDESYREHQQIRDILTDLSTMNPISDEFDRKVEELKAKIRHHVSHQEGEMLPALMERMSKEQLLYLGRRIHDRKLDLKLRMAA